MTEQQIIETLATKVMGWKADTFHLTANGWEIWSFPEGGSVLRGSWNPLKNIADAWQVVDKLVLERGIPIELQSSIREYRVSFNGEDWTYGNTAQEAISRAALMMI